MRQEFSKQTKRAAFLRCNMKCECGCGLPLKGVEYHHVIECAIGGTNELDNCQVLRTDCHRRITGTQSAPRAARSRRIRDKGAGITRTKKKMSYRKFDGTPVWK